MAGRLLPPRLSPGRVAALAVAAVAVSAAVLVTGGSAQAAPPPPLPIPQSLTGDWTAPSGTYSMPSSPTTVGVAATVDLSAATITGTGGWLFTLADGAALTVVGGSVNGTGPGAGITGLVYDNIPDGASASVTVQNTTLSHVGAIVYEPNPGGAIDISFSGVQATSIDVQNSTLTGGVKPPSGSPAGIHSLDDDAFNVAVPGTSITVYNSTITGYVTRSQGDSIVGETRVASADIEYDTLGHNSDSGGIDSKITSVTFAHNTVYSDGVRAIASHFGTLTAYDNTIYQVGKTAHGVHGKAYQATGTLNASNDVVTLGQGAFLAEADVATSGSGGPSTYPRVGAITLTTITAPDGTILTGPLVVKPASGYTPTATAS